MSYFLRVLHGTDPSLGSSPNSVVTQVWKPHIKVIFKEFELAKKIALRAQIGKVRGFGG